MVGLLSISGGNIFRMGDDGMDTTVLQMVEYGDPVFTGRFHADILAVKFVKLVYKFDEIRLMAGKLTKMIDRLIGDLMSNDDTAGKLVFVDIDTTADGKHDSTHRKDPLLKRKREH